MVFFATKFTLGLGKTTATETATLINNMFDKQKNVTICKASTLFGARSPREISLCDVLWRT